MLDQAGVGTRAYSPQEDEVKIILIEGHFKIIAWFNLPAFSDRLGNY